MKKCNQCGAEQEDGKFCGNCGATLIDREDVSDITQSEQINKKYEAEQISNNETEKSSLENLSVQEETGATTATGYVTQSQDHQKDTMNRIKSESKQFWSYYTYYLKHPSQVFNQRDTEFKNGIINITIMIITLALSTYFLVRNFIIGTGMVYFDSVPFFPIFGNTLLFTVLFMALVVVVLFAVTKLLGPDYSFKEIVTVYSGHLSLAVAFSVIAFVLMLIKANLIGMILIGLVIGIAVTSTPIYLISRLLTQKSKTVDPYYGYLIYLVVVGIGTFIIMSILADSTMGGFINELQYMTY